MAMRGLSLDGAKKLQAAIDNYQKQISGGGLGWNSSAYYGKNTKLASLIDDIIHYVYQQPRSARSTISSYVNQLNQIVAKYSSFDNSGSQTLGKVLPSGNSKKS